MWLYFLDDNKWQINFMRKLHKQVTGLGFSESILMNIFLMEYTCIIRLGLVH